jgi:hypothetical protein
MRAKLVGNNDLPISDSKKLKLSHNTDGSLVLSTNKNRLIPNSISCVKYNDKVRLPLYGKTKYIIDIEDDSKILDIDINDTFYQFGKEIDTPINRGKQVYKYAIANNIDIIRLKNVPMIGIEYAILNLQCIRGVITDK